jgi:hypothetical protein
MKKHLLAFALLLAGMALWSTPALASASLYEYYSLSSGPSVQAAQIGSITGTTLYFADGSQSIVRDWTWWLAHTPHVGDYVYCGSCGQSALSSMSSFDDLDCASAESFEGAFGLETYVHGGHEPVIIIVD